MRGGILLSHPHAATVASGTAAALEREGCLALYVTGVGAAEGTWMARALTCLGKRRPVARNRVIRGVSADRFQSLGWLELGARGVATLAKGVRARRPSAYDAMYLAHDAIVAVMPWPSATRIVYAYEDAALRTFRRAARLGLERVWDLPLPYYATLEKMWLEEARRWPGAMGTKPRLEPELKKRRKDAELGLATRVSVPSTYTRESLETAGVRVPIVVTPFGFPIEDFSAKASPPSGPFTVVAVGTQDLRKGTPYLFEAWKRAALRDARLLLVGPMQLTEAFVSRYAGLFEHVPHVPRALLGDVYRSADLLVLPTLGDGCPLVVQEAMSCGTPVITTRCGSGPDLITDSVDGWIVPERDVQALVERLREAAEDRQKVYAIGRAARARAERWTWLHAGSALAHAFCPREVGHGRGRL